MPSRPRWVGLGQEVGLLAHVVEQGAVGVDALVLLGVVARRRRRGRSCTVAGVGVGLAGQDAQQARLAGAVEPQHEQALAPADVEADVLEHGGPPYDLARSVDLEHDPPAVGRLGEADAQRPLGLGRVDRRGLEAGDALLDALGHAAPSSPWPRTGRPGSAAGRSPWPAARGQLGQPDLVLGPRPRGTASTCPCTRRGAGRLLAGAVEVEHAGDGLVEQVEVVADHQERAPVAAEELHQPRLGVGVEVVRGLVEQQHVAAGEQDAGQLDPAALAAGEHRHRQVEAVGAEAEAVRPASGPRRRRRSRRRRGSAPRPG